MRSKALATSRGYDQRNRFQGRNYLTTATLRLPLPFGEVPNNP
jgi:hypothetical protein